EGPSAFSLEASLQTSVRPYSRFASSIGFPGTYGFSRRMFSATSGAVLDGVCVVVMARDGSTTVADMATAWSCQLSAVSCQFRQRQERPGALVVCPADPGRFPSRR